MLGKDVFSLRRSLGLLLVFQAVCIQAVENKQVQIVSPLHYDTSPPLRELGGISNGFFSLNEKIYTQNSFLLAPAPPLVLNFEGIGQGFTGPSGTFKIEGAPPNPVFQVGHHYIVQQVNSSLAVFDKKGRVLFGPVKTNILWRGFGNECEVSEDGEGTLLYDVTEKRWFISQVLITQKPYLQCIAVSTSEDPTGSYYRYSYKQDLVHDSSRIGIWDESYFITFNIFNDDQSFLNAGTCAYNRKAMIKGIKSAAQCITFPDSGVSPLPGTLVGKNFPPKGTPFYLASMGNNSLLFWKLRVDWQNTSQTELEDPIEIRVDPFLIACGGRSCIPQKGTKQHLYSNSQSLSTRLSYRKFDTHEALVVSHSIQTGSTTGIRWYEIRNPESPFIYQQGTYAPDKAHFRWLPSAAIDKAGGIAIGYNISSKNMHPGIRYAARNAKDPLGVMGEEGIIIEGTGSQLDLDNWGDFASMPIDPVDGCTIHFGSSYLVENGSFNWHTRLGAFRLSDCKIGAEEP